jgi:hypothetical protein
MCRRRALLIGERPVGLALRQREAGEGVRHRGLERRVPGGHEPAAEPRRLPGAPEDRELDAAPAGPDAQQARLVQALAGLAAPGVDHRRQLQVIAEENDSSVLQVL